jgi:hypothetical protein
MGVLSDLFEERFGEISAYLDFLDNIDALAKDGVPRLGANGAVVTPQQMKILYSSVYLQIYNLVEATITRCLEELTNAACHANAWLPIDMVSELRREWIRSAVGSHKDLNYENRLNYAVKMIDYLIQSAPLSKFNIEKGGGGNWDDNSIEAIAKRIGLKLKVTPSARRGVKEKFRDDLGALALVVKRRNDLAHGSLSFVECGEGDTASELRLLTTKAAAYMREIVAAFETFIEQHLFLIPEKRPEPA